MVADADRKFEKVGQCCGEIDLKTIGGGGANVTQIASITV
jgi:hypothetical protein